MSASSAVRASHDGAGTGASTLPASRRASATSSDGKAPVSAPDSADAAVAAAAAPQAPAPGAAAGEDGLVRGADGKPLHHLQQGVVHIPKNRLWIVMPGLMLTVYCA
jgi:hypothetical protein